MDELELPRSKRMLVVNHSDLSTGVTINDVERSLGMPVATKIPASAAVPTSINQGVTLVSSDPKHAVAKAIVDLATQITGRDKAESTKSRRAIFTGRKPKATS
jgi:pilus assembly protein CpaE